MAVSGSLISYIAIGIFVIIVFTAIYIGRQLYKERVRKDLENSGKRRELELELGPLPDKVMHESLRTLKITPKSSLENSSTASSSQGKRRKSSSNIERNSKSFDRKVKPRPSRDSSVNGSSKYDSTNGSRYSRSVSKQSSLAIKIPNEIPPPPPPSPLKSQDDSIKTLTNIIPSDISGSTYTPPHMSSKASSQIDLKTHSLMPSQPTTHVNYPEFA